MSRRLPPINVHMEDAGSGPVYWAAWRDAKNEAHTAVADSLHELRRLLPPRRQEQLVGADDQPVRGFLWVRQSGSDTRLDTLW